MFPAKLSPLQILQRKQILNVTWNTWSIIWFLMPAQSDKVQQSIPLRQIAWYKLF